MLEWFILGMATFGSVLAITAFSIASSANGRANQLAGRIADLEDAQRVIDDGPQSMPLELRARAEAYRELDRDYYLNLDEIRWLTQDQPANLAAQPQLPVNDEEGR